ncbi:hypothetical protein G6F19_004865 [Rhizopus arrhizus]|nr:hypothetical protein G6F19_004865 [Rhizopus arrhizus]
MSWQSYVDNNLIGTGNVSQAAICGQAGGIWAASAGFQPSPFEIRSIADAFANSNIAAANGILVEGNKYIMINAEGRFIYGRNATDGVYIFKTMKTFLFCVFNEGIQPDNCAKTVEALGDHLISIGY